MSSNGENFPGKAVIDSLLRLQTQTVQRHVDAMQQAWGDIMDDPSAKTVLQGYSKLTQACMESTKELLRAYSSPFIDTEASLTDCPNVVFTVDKDAQAGTPDSREIALATAAPDNTAIVQTQFTPPLPSDAKLEVSLSSDKFSARIALTLTKPIPAPSVHTALVYLDSHPAPKLPVAIVIVNFTGKP